MINATENDIGRRVSYLRWRDIPAGTLNTANLQYFKPRSGVITSLNKYFIFVKYDGDNYSVATPRTDLSWD